MEIKLIDKDLSLKVEDILRKAGSFAAICYSEKEFEYFCDNYESNEKIAKFCIDKGHHSIFDHIHISLNLKNIPKYIVIMLNNIGYYNTSEKSGRYTRFNTENGLYKKWMDLLINEIKRNEHVENHVKNDDNLVKKLAMENARNFLPIDFPTNLIYTTSVRQLCYLRYNLNKITEKYSDDKYQNIKNFDTNKFISDIKKFIDELEKIEFIKDINIKPKDGNDYMFNKIDILDNIFVNNETGLCKINFNDFCYNKIDSCSISCASQLQRHRTSPIYMSLITNNTITENFVMPPIVLDNEKLKKEWENDYNSLNYISMGHSITVSEFSDINALHNKALERLCSRAQLEVCKFTKDTVEVLEYKGFGFNDNNETKPRCGSFKCNEPCKYGIRGLNRII